MRIQESTRSGVAPVVLSGILVALLVVVPVTTRAADADAGTASADHPAMQAADASHDMAHAPQMQLAEVAICRKVEDRAPVAAGDSFASGVDNLYCFTEIHNAGAPQQIYHRWYVGDELVCEVPMHVEGPRWRCWSEKTIPASWQGDCHVEIVNEAGERIGETRFALTDQPAAAADSWQNEPAAEQPADGS
jgi:Protein of unknown function (DUF2914)